MRRRDVDASGAARRPGKTADANATAIVTGLQSCDPVRRTPWGTIIVAEENGADGGLYEILDPVHITTPIAVTDRATGANSDPLHLAKRQAVGALSFESFAIRPDGTTIYGDELAPSNGNAGGGIYKFVPAVPFVGGAPITVPAMSPLVSGSIYGLRVAAAGSSNWGQGRRDRQGRVDPGQPGRAPASSTRTATSSCGTRSCCRSSPATTGLKTWTSIPSRVRTACSAPAGRTRAA